MSLPSGPWYSLLRKWFSWLCKEKLLSSAYTESKLGSRVCPWRQKPPDASLLLSFLSWEHTVVSLCQTRVYHMWFSLLQLSLQRINQLWQMKGLGKSVCPREGKSYHFGGKITVWEDSLSVYAPPPPNTTNCFKG